jgi:hypothetical protein
MEKFCNNQEYNGTELKCTAYNKACPFQPEDVHYGLVRDQGLLMLFVSKSSSTDERCQKYTPLPRTVEPLIKRINGVV